jgi:hypothetical protein
MSLQELPHATARICQYATVAGLMSHWAYFIRGEHIVEAPMLALAYLVVASLIFVGEYVYGGDGVVSSISRTSVICLSYLGPLWSSMLVYRVYFHRLKSFPGPSMAKLSKFWHAGQVAPDAGNYRLLERLHSKYGDFVRTGIYNRLRTPHRSC